MGLEGRIRHRLKARTAWAAVLLAASGPVAAGSLRAQEAPSPATRAPDPGRIHFASFDIGFGGAFAQDADPGVSYAVAFDVANLLVRGTSLRFGFRFWSSEDTSDPAEVVDLDDAVFDFMLRKGFGGPRLSGYGGLGVGFHIVSARLAELIEIQEERDGFRPGLQAILGGELALADRGFISLFVEGLGSLVDQVSNVSAHAGFRIRFDGLGGVT